MYSHEAVSAKFEAPLRFRTLQEEQILKSNNGWTNCSGSFELVKSFSTTNCSFSQEPVEIRRGAASFLGFWLIRALSLPEPKRFVGVHRGLRGIGKSVRYPPP